MTAPKMLLTFAGLPNSGHVALIAIVAVPALALAIRNPREALVVEPGLVALFALGFIGPFVDEVGHIALAAIGLAVIICMPFVLGRLARSERSAFVSGLMFLFISGLAVGYGIYAARQTGWGGLTLLGQSSEWPHGNLGVIWFPFIFLSPALLFAAFIYGLICSRTKTLLNPTVTPVT
jgi:hypothetical protein